MRRRLILVALAITSMVTIAFLGPLAFYVYQNARDSAIINGKILAQAVAPLVLFTKDVETVDAFLPVAYGQRLQLSPEDPPGRRLTIYFPDGRRAGYPEAETDNVVIARNGQKAFTKNVPGGVEILYPTTSPGNNVPPVIRVLIPSAELHKNVYNLWVIFGAVALALMLAGVAVADRLARSIVDPVRELADVTRRLSAGEAEARTTPAGPPEIADVGSAVNHLADRIDELLTAEREMMADLSHRLRTPLSALRLNAEAIPDQETSERIMADIGAMEHAVSNVIREARAPRRAADVSCDLVEICRTRAEFWAVLAEDQQRPWSVALPGRAVQIPLRPNDLEAAMDAMLGNVFEYTPEGTAVHVNASVDGKIATLRIEDDGPGFAEGFVPERGSSGGTSTGLGLDIIKKTAQAAGGGLNLSNRPGGGARVEMWFPLRQPSTFAAGRANARDAKRITPKPGDRNGQNGRDGQGGGKDSSARNGSNEANEQGRANESIATPATEPVRRLRLIKWRLRRAT